jgi:hypothetical protein
VKRVLTQPIWEGKYPCGLKVENAIYFATTMGMSQKLLNNTVTRNQKKLFNYTKSPEDATYGYISLRQTYTKVLTDIPFNLSYKIEIDKLFNKIVFGKPHYDYNQTRNIRKEN